MTGQQTATAASVDLPALAAIWVERWLKYGGGLVLDANCDRLQISMDERGWRRAEGPRWQRHWHDGWNVGRWRELSDLCKEVPGLRAAIIEHVAQRGVNHGSAGYFLWQAKPED